MGPRFELFATGAATPPQVWRVVGEPRRLPEWTDAEEVVEVYPEPVAAGTQIVVRVAGSAQQWRVTTAEHHLLEASTDTPRGRLGLGVRVVADPLGSRLVLAGAIDADGRWPRVRARLLDAPAMRRRFDRWSQAALRAAVA